MKVITAFNAITQKDEEAVVTVDHNGEFVLTFEDESFLKFPGDMTKKQIEDSLVKHKEMSEGVVTTAEVEAQNDKKLSMFDDAEE